MFKTRPKSAQLVLQGGRGPWGQAMEEAGPGPHTTSRHLRGSVAMAGWLMAPAAPDKDRRGGGIATKIAVPDRQAQAFSRPILPVDQWWGHGLQVRPGTASY